MSMCTVARAVYFLLLCISCACVAWPTFQDKQTVPKCKCPYNESSSGIVMKYNETDNTTQIIVWQSKPEEDAVFTQNHLTILKTAAVTFSGIFTFCYFFLKWTNIIMGLLAAGFVIFMSLHLGACHTEYKYGPECNTLVVAFKFVVVQAITDAMALWSYYWGLK